MLRSLYFWGLILLLILFFFTDLMVGSYSSSINDLLSFLSGSSDDSVGVSVISNLRFPRALVAVLSGSALAVSGLQMQSIFRNPLAGPYVLGVSAGSGLGVALLLMTGLPLLASPVFLQWGIILFAGLGAFIVLMLIAGISYKIRDISVILIIGMMLGSGISAVITILQYFSNESDLKNFVVWSMGSLGGVYGIKLMFFSITILCGLLLSAIFIKPLNALLMGEDYARSVGVNIKQTRIITFICTSLLTGATTAFCGPIAFVGIAIPHLCRFILKSNNPRILLPYCILTGAVFMLVADILSKTGLNGMVLPINSITSLMGIPVVVWVIVKFSKTGN